MERRRARPYTAGVNLDTLIRLYERIRAGIAEPWEFIVEIFLIGISINWCASVLHGTRGTRLIRGLLIVLVAVTLIVRVIAAQWGWSRLELLYHYFVTALAFIALVAFQPELRRALIRAGEMRFFRREAGGNKLIGALVEAAGVLSRNRHGAVIAIQRDVGLASWAEAGVPVHAEVSAPLLSSIFYPNSPLHDLGVIIRGNRVVAASCQFPMAESGELDAALGSRHRAAVGLSQESDALVMVVSEETGAISLADGGELIRYLSLEDLEKELERRLNQAPASIVPFAALRSYTDFKRFIRRAAVVLPLTLVVWFLADQASMIRLDGVAVELSIRQLPNVQRDIIDPAPAVFRLEVRGSTREIEALRARSGDAPLKVEWTDQTRYLTPGTFRLANSELMRLLESTPELRGRGVSIEKVEPDSLRLGVDEVVAATLPLRAETGTNRVEGVVFEPAEARVWMRKRDFDRVDAAQRFASVWVADQLSEVAHDAPISIDRAAIGPAVAGAPILRVEPAEVRVTLRVIGAISRKQLQSLTVRVLTTPGFLSRFAVELEDAPDWLIDIEVEGDRLQVDSLKADDVLVYVVPVEEPTSADSTQTGRVQVRLPPGLRLVSPEKTVQYRLKPVEDPTPP
ncbi:MAG: TIGR00159 family protein [Phycisphaerales bacterium]|nr:TIGR00159 family protein [Phycisphaerales bacterium]